MIEVQYEDFEENSSHTGVPGADVSGDAPDHGEQPAVLCEREADLYRIRAGHGSSRKCQPECLRGACHLASV